MRLRATAFGVLAIAFAGALAAAVPDTRWRATATPPRAALPTVEVTLGYPGPYVPPRNSPIELRATATERFNGYIGFHYEVQGKHTIDAAVVSEVRLQPGESWSLTTWSHVEQWGTESERNARELAIVWFDLDMRRLAKVTAGVPPWSLDGRALLVAPEGAAAKTVMGRETIAVPPDASLSDVAQWYRGFDGVAMPLEVWLALPPRVRDAIFGSNAPLAFYGFPRPEQKLARLDAALLPVQFKETPSSYTIPWPHPEAGSSRSAPQAWAVKSGAVAVGDKRHGPLVIGRSATWAASADLLADRPPATEIRWYGLKKNARFPGWLRVMLELRTLAVAIVALALALFLWVWTRRTPRLAIVIASAACAVLLIAARSELTSRDTTFQFEDVTDKGDGIRFRDVTMVDSGPAPARGRAMAAGLARTAVFDPLTNALIAEIRDAGTPSGFGGRWSAMAGWDTAFRRWTRRELAPVASIRVVSVTPERLVIDYVASSPVTHGVAAWNVGTRRCYGEARLPDPVKGRVAFEVHGGSVAFLRGATDWRVLIRAQTQDVTVHLINPTRNRWLELAWGHEIDAAVPRSEPFRIDATLHQNAEGAFAGSVLVPPMTTRFPATVVIDDATMSRLPELEIATEKGVWRVANKRPSYGRLWGSGTFAVPDEAVLSVRNGGVMVLTAARAQAAAKSSTARMEITFGGADHER